MLLNAAIIRTRNPVLVGVALSGLFWPVPTFLVLPIVLLTVLYYYCVVFAVCYILYVR